MKSIVLTVLGILWFMSAIWIGSYVMYEIPFNDWRSFPLTMTFAINVLGGIVLFNFNVRKIGGKP